ncbi:MAG: ADP/ATP-dependent (S)-NAD(P)H-hydrate dehydratase [Nocardioides sp.]
MVGMVRYVGTAADAVRLAHPEVVGAGRVQAWVTGSGGGPEADDALDLCLGDRVPIVVDADALRQLRGPLTVPAVLTPHAGELAELLGVDRADVEESGLRFVRDAAQRFAAVVLLKGRHTLVADPAGQVRVNTTGVPWLATAGAGDVLAGLVGALLAGGLDPFDAAAVGAWLHGAAATMAARGRPLTAGAVAEALPGVIRALR